MSPQNQNSNEPTKAEVQTTKLNKMPIPGEFDTEISAEEAPRYLNSTKRWS